MAPDTNMVLSSKLGQDSSIGHPDWPGPGGDMTLRHQHGLDFNVISASGGSTGHSHWQDSSGSVALGQIF